MKNNSKLNIIVIAYINFKALGVINHKFFNALFQI